MSDCGNKTPVGHFLTARDSSTSVGMTESWIITHLNELAESDFDLLTELKQEFSIVHCPRSHSYFGHSPFQFEKLKNLGFSICLGTDSLASNDDLSLFSEMRAFQKEFPKIRSEEILKMVTTNSARALRQENSLGKIRSGFAADLIAVPCARSTSAFEEIVGFDRPVGWSIIGDDIYQPA